MFSSCLIFDSCISIRAVISRSSETVLFETLFRFVIFVQLLPPKGLTDIIETPNQIPRELEINKMNSMNVILGKY